MDLLPNYLTLELDLHKNTYLCNTLEVWGKSACKSKYISRIITKQTRVIKLLKIFAQDNNVLNKTLINKEVK